MKIIYLRDERKNSNKTEPLGKAGRRARMFAKNKRIVLPKVDRVATAVAWASDKPRAKVVDIANYKCTKGKTTPYMVRAKQKRTFGQREPFRI